MIRWLTICACTVIVSGCNKKSSSPAPPVQPPGHLVSLSVKIDGLSGRPVYYNSNIRPVIKFSFNAPVNRSLVSTSVTFKNKTGLSVAYSAGYENNDSIVVIQPAAALDYITKYKIIVSTDLKSVAGGSLSSEASIDFITKIDSTRKYPAITDDSLLTLVQKQTFNYFWDFAHPVSGLARERSNGDNNLVTSGGSGFGIMALVVGVNRGFITRAQGLTRMQTIVGFLKNTAQKFHNAFPHWLNGTTGAVIPFSTNDDGADLVETSYLLEGLLCARQYFNGADPDETALRTDINTIWNNVEWDWFRQSNQNVLYWHWSPNHNWQINMQIRGWNECLITYILAASSTTHGVPPVVYTNGWTANGTNGFTNGRVFYGYTLPLGVDLGGPLFFEHYSFLGINPTGLSDAYANYGTQTKNHTLINNSYCRTNPRNYFGYSDSVWGLTASDIENGYTASSPANDVSVIAPTAALSSFPYTPVESMKALKFYYYVLGDKIWKDYGFTDAFSLQNTWFAGSFLAIDQGPIVAMIENYRTGLLWNLFTSCPEIKAGMLSLGFTAPYL